MDTIRLEFHAHTIFSKDSLTRPKALIEACHRKGIDRLVVTDHNTIRGALECKNLAPELVIIGEEIMTNQGELLAAFVREEVPGGLPAVEAIRRLQEQGAFISVSHPFDFTRSGHWKLTDLELIAPHVDAIEIFNARCLSMKFNARAAAFAKERGLPGTSGSDAHGLIELGAATQFVPDFNDADGLRKSIRQATYRNQLLPSWTRLVSRIAVIYKALFKPVISF